MNKKLYSYFTEDNSSGKKCNEKWLSKNNKELYESIILWCNNIEVLKNIEFKRKIYHFIYNKKDIPLCCVCGGEVKYKRLKDGYCICCSNECTKKSPLYKEKWNLSWKKNNLNGESIEKRFNTVIKKYGSIENYKNKIKDSKKNNTMNKYGVDFYFQTEIFKNKRKKTLKDKYGCETFNNPIKTKITRINNGTQIIDDNIDDFISYKKIVMNRSKTIYRNNKNIINPDNLEIGVKLNNLDHKFSIKQGFLNNIPIEIITHPCNLELINYKDNLIKQDTCSISIEDLLNNIIEYKYDIKFTNNELYEKYKNIKDISINILNKK